MCAYAENGTSPRKKRVGLELAPLRGKNSFEPRPSNEILVLLRFFLENLRKAPRHFFCATYYSKTASRYDDCRLLFNHYFNGWLF